MGDDAKVTETPEFQEAFARSRMLLLFVDWVRALQEHDLHQNDPAKNVATGQALYSTESALRNMARDLSKDDKIKAVERKALATLIELSSADVEAQDKEKAVRVAARALLNELEQQRRVRSERGTWILAGDRSDDRKQG